MARPEVVRLAQALRGSTARHVDRATRRQIEAEVKALFPLRLDVLEADDVLGEEDVTIGRALKRHLEDEPLSVGDTLVLVEVGDGDYDAVDVLGGDE